MMDECAREEMGAVVSMWRALVARWDLAAYDRVDLLGMGVDFHDDPLPTLTALGERRMRILIEIDHALRALYARDEDLRAWLVESAEFDRPPIEKMAGDLADLREVRALMEELAWPPR